MVEPETTDLVRQAVARALSSVGGDVVTRVEVRRGWGDALHVRIHSRLPRGADVELGRRLRATVDEVVPGRHTVEIVWASSG